MNSQREAREQGLSDFIESLGGGCSDAWQDLPADELWHKACEWQAAMNQGGEAFAYATHGRGVAPNADSELIPVDDVSDYMPECVTPVYTHQQPPAVPDSLIQAIKIQCSHGSWNYNPYMHGMANGMIFAKSCMDDTDPEYLSAPDSWIVDYIDTQQPPEQD